MLIISVSSSNYLNKIMLGLITKDNQLQILWSIAANQINSNAQLITNKTHNSIWSKLWAKCLTGTNLIALSIISN